MPKPSISTQSIGFFLLILFIAFNGHAQTGAGFALGFDGTNDFVRPNANLFTNVTNTFTIEAWVRPSAARAVTTETNAGISGATGQRYAIFPEHGDNAYGAGHAGAGVSVGTNGISVFEHAANYLPSPLVYAVANTGWTHVAVVYLNRQPSLYVNGALARTGLTSTMIVHPSAGLGESGQGYGYFSGQLDEFRIWNVARNVSEIRSNMFALLSGAEPGLVVHYHFNEGMGGSTADSAALNGNTTGNLSNGVAWVTSTAPAGRLSVALADSLLIDTNGNGQVNANDTLRYTVTVRNNSTNTLTNLVLNVPANPNTTLVPGSVKAPPKATNDGPATNSAPGQPFHGALNVALNVSAPGLLANDNLGAPAATVASFGGGSFPGTATTTAAGSIANAPGIGTLTVNADGSFTFTPTATFNGPATFQYRITNSLGASIATATLAIGVRPSAVNDTLIVSGNTLFDSSLVPLSLLGNDAGTLIGVSSIATPTFGTFSFNANGQFIFTPDVGEIGSANVNYTITNGFGAVQAQVAVTVGNPVWYIDGASVAGTADGRSHWPFKTIAAFNAVNNGAANNPGDNQAILVRDGTYTDGITLRVGQRLIGDGSSGGVTNALGVALPPGSAVAPGVAIPAFSGTDAIITSAAGNGVTLNANNTIRGITVGNTPAGVGYLGGSVGSLNISESSKVGAGGAISITGGGGLDVGFETLGSTNAPGAAISLVNCGGTFSAATGDINAPVGAGIFISGSGGVISYPGSITKDSAGRIVDIQNGTGGSITLSGALAQNNASGMGINLSSNASTTITFSGTTKTFSTGANPAVSLVSNTGATINFTGGGLIITTTTGTGFNATGGGTISVLGAGNIINSGNAGLNMVNTTIGAGGLTFQSISSSGGSSPGIVMQNTTGSGTVSVTGTGGAGSGGTIANKTGANIWSFVGGVPTLNGTTVGVGIYLNNATPIALASMQLNGFANAAVSSFGSSGFTMTNTVVNGSNGDDIGQDESSLFFYNPFGSATISGGSISGGLEDNLHVVKTGGTALNRFTVTGTTFGFNNTTSGNNNILIESQNAGTTLNFTLQGCTIQGARADWINASANSGSIMDLVIGGNTPALGNMFTNLNSAAHPGAAGGGNRVVLRSVGTMTFDINNNRLAGAKGEGIRVWSSATGALTGNATGRVRNNIIGVAGIANSGSSEGSGIFLFGDGGSRMTTAVENNQVYQYNNHGISMTFGDEINNSGGYAVIVQGNTINTPGTINSDFNGIHLNNGTVGATDDFTTCAAIGGAGALRNSVVGSGKGTIPPNNADIRLRQRQATTVRLPGYAGSPTDTAAVPVFLQANNNLGGTPTSAASTSSPPGGGFIGGVPCPTP